MLEGKTFLITGIADQHSLAMYTAQRIQAYGGQVVCTGLGVSSHHKNLASKSRDFLQKNFLDFETNVHQVLGKSTPTAVLDVTLPATIQDFCMQMQAAGICFDGFLHAIAMDKTIRQKQVKPLLEVSREDFWETMQVSAFSLIEIIQALEKKQLLNAGASICSLSYIAAERVSFHPYRNISIAKAALERITVELADEMGRKNGTRVNCIRFSPYMGSKAGNATLRIEDFERSEQVSPLGNATPEDLAEEIIHLFRPNSRITGEIRHVDGGYHIMG